MVKNAERFWKKVTKTDGCWNWNAGVGTGGYGWFKCSDNKSRNSHRIAWHLTFGAVPDCSYVLHKCDNRLCVNPEHLFLGSHLDNLKDMFSKGRNVKGAVVATAKLTEEQVREIRKRYLLGETQTKMASEFHMHQSSLSLLVNNKNWKHVA